MFIKTVSVSKAGSETVVQFRSSNYVAFFDFCLDNDFVKFSVLIYALN